MDESTIIGCWFLASTRPWGARSLAFLDSDGRLTELIFFPFPLLKSDPQCEALIQVITDATSTRMRLDVSVFSSILTRAHPYRFP